MKIEDVLRLCINEYDGRPVLRNPFYIEGDGCGHVVATDGKIAVWYPHLGEPPCKPVSETFITRFMPGVISNWNSHEGEEVEIPDMQEPEEGPCDLCGGTGASRCPTCLTEHACKACKGTGQETAPDTAEINGVTFKVRDLVAIKKMGARLKVDAEKKHAPQYFKGTAHDNIRFYGVVMPTRT